MTMQAVDVEQATLEDLLAVGIELEAAAQRIYTELGRIFGHCPEVAEFWRFLAADEASHKNRLVQIRAGMSLRRLSHPADARMLHGARKLLDLNIEERLRDVHDLDDAYELANDLESSETNTIFQFFLTELSKDAHMVATLMQDLDEHVERLMTEFPVEYVTRTERVKVKAIHS